MRTGDGKTERHFTGAVPGSLQTLDDRDAPCPGLENRIWAEYGPNPAAAIFCLPELWLEQAPEPSKSGQRLVSGRH